MWVKKEKTTILTSESIKEYETKYALNNSSAHSIMQWLKGSLHRDSENPEYSVFSMYYDTVDWQLLREKINSDFYKRKVRLRWYADIQGNCPTNNSILEVKLKHGKIRKKIKINTGISGQWLSGAKLNHQKLRDLPRQLLPMKQAGHDFVYPVFLIAYKRLRFVDPLSGYRLCLDYDIHVPRVNVQALPRRNSFFLKQAVLEIKGPNPELPISLKRLTKFGLRKEAFSKYAMCFKHIMSTVG